jgi:hypothetical protein
MFVPKGLGVMLVDRCTTASTVGLATSTSCTDADQPDHAEYDLPKPVDGPANARTLNRDAPAKVPDNVTDDHDPSVPVPNVWMVPPSGSTCTPNLYFALLVNVSFTADGVPDRAGLLGVEGRE